MRSNVFVGRGCKPRAVVNGPAKTTVSQPTMPSRDYRFATPQQTAKMRADFISKGIISNVAA